jgi:hypothetical protein
MESSKLIGHSQIHPDDLYAIYQEDLELLQNIHNKPLKESFIYKSYQELQDKRAFLQE